jgi:hypothetical protein
LNIGGNVKLPGLADVSGMFPVFPGAASTNQIPAPKNRGWYSKDIKKCVFMFRVFIRADPI